MPVALFVRFMRLLGCPVCTSCDCAAPNGTAAYGCGWSRGDDGWVCGECADVILECYERGVEA